MQKQKNLLSLQNLVKRDPESYVHEFETAYDFFKSLFDAFKLAPTKYDRELAEQVMFISQVSHCYRDKLAEFPQMLVSLLKQSASLMDSEMRMAFCKALILMRNKGIVSPLDIMQLFCRLFKCQDKLLRRTLAGYIVQDVKNINAKHKNAKLNSSLQNHMLTVIQEENIASKKCAEIMVDLYRRGVWRDAKTVNFIGMCCFSKVTKILVTGLRFFCAAGSGDGEGGGGGGASSDDDSDIDDEAYKHKSKGAALAHRVGPKTNKRKKRLERQLQTLKKHKKKKRRVDAFDTASLHLLHDPQTFAERLLKQVETTSEPFEIRLLMLDLCSRLVGVHKLQVLGLYPLLQRYLSPRQSEVTRLLLFAAQASHSMAPPDCLEPMVRTVADNFVTDRASAEAIAVGLNSIREICARAPYAMTEELLSDLVQYRSYRDKNVSSAAKSLIQLYREANPAMLHRRDRGRPNVAQAEAASNAASGGTALAQFGQSDAKDYLPGAEILQLEDGDGGGEAGDDGDWEEEEDSDDGSGEWIDIPQSDDEDLAGKAAASGDAPLDPAAARLRAQAVATTRILSQRDFKRLEQAQALKRIQATTSGRKRRLAEAAAATSAGRDDKDDDDREVATPADAEHPSGLAQLSDITRLAKRPKMSRTERMESASDGRRNDPDAKKYGFQVRRMNPHASSTNSEKRKSKAFSMVKHKARRKTGGRSFRDKQIAFKDALLKRMRKSKR